MIADAGLAGTKVTVWSETRSPRQEYCAYLADLLNKLGFKASLKVIQDSVYFQTIGNQSLHPQAGFADWTPGLPEPVGLLPAAVEGRHPGDEQRELRQRQRPEDREPAREARGDPGDAAAVEAKRLAGRSTSTSHSQALRRRLRLRDGTEVHVDPGRLRLGGVQPGELPGVLDRLVSSRGLRMADAAVVPAEIAAGTTTAGRSGPLRHCARSGSAATSSLWSSAACSC